MGLDKCSVNINPSRKELKPHGSFEFPCAGYWDWYGEQTRREFPWHWHEEMEIIYIRRGALLLLLPGRSCRLKKGDCFVVNANVLHYISADPECELQSLVFHPKLVAGETDSVFAVKYVSPLIASPDFAGCPMPGKNCPEEVRCFHKAFMALANETPGFEFVVRENVSKICLFLYEKLMEEKPERKAGGRKGMNQDSLRVQEMLDYIHHHYQENISLHNIAGAAALGERECLRCFKRTLQTSPMQYLLKYKVMQGAELLLNEPSKSVSEAAVSCGFDSPSHFSKMFKRFYGCTPREYRKDKLTYQR